MGMKLSSTAFAGNGKIPARYACDGANLSPPLSWSGAPAGTQSLALVCADPDAPGGTWYHWAIYDIPPQMTMLAENHASGEGGAIREGTNDFNRVGYGGPCPPHAHGTHHYHFTIYALMVEHLPLKAPSRCRDVERICKANALDHASLVGLYAR